MVKTKVNLATTNTEDALLTVREIALLDRCSEKTVRRAIDSGLLLALRIGPGGRLLRVTLKAHEAYRKSQQL